MTVQTVTKIKFNSIISGTAGFYRFTAMTDTGLTYTGLVSRDMPGEAWTARVGNDFTAVSMSRKHAVAEVMRQWLPSCESVETVRACEVVNA